jgi:hypothetical protein
MTLVKSELRRLTRDVLRAVGLLAAREDLADGTLLLRFTHRTEVWVRLRDDEPSPREHLMMHGRRYRLLSTGRETIQ